MAQLPATGITTKLISNSLGVASNDVGYLCSSNRINKWSKWKPIGTNATTLDNSLITTIKSGLSIQPITLWNYKLFSTNEDAGGFDIYNNSTQKKWSYTPPTGTSSQPYRLGDYRNYQNASVPTFNFSSVDFSQYVGDVANFNWTADLTPTQQTGGLVAGDLFPTGYYLGVMVIDYENDGFPVRSYATNSTSIATNQTVSLDIASFNSGTYLFCFFISSTSITQVNNPSQATTSAVGNIYPLEDGIFIGTIENYYHFPTNLWKFPKYELVGSDFNSNLAYTLYTGTYSPTISNDFFPPVTMKWDNYNDTFTIEPTISPAALYKWSVKITMWDDTINWVNDTYKGLITWTDTDLIPLTIAMKTNSSNVITICMVESGNFASPIWTATTTKVLSTNSTTPTIVEISNYNNSSLNRIGLKVDNTVYDQTMDGTWMTQSENPPIFKFGYDLDSVDAPVGLTYNDITVSAYGRA